MIHQNDRILMIRLSAIGDVIQTLPSLYALKSAFPESTISWVVEEAAYHFLKGHPLIDNLILFPKKEITQTLKKQGLFKAIQLIRQFSKKLKELEFDLAIDFQNLFKSGMIAFLSGAGKRVGFSKGREGNFLFINKKYPAPKEQLHFVDWELTLVKNLGASVKEIKFILPDFSSEEMIVKDFLEANKIANFFCIAAGTSWPNKCWTPEGMARLADELSHYGKIIFIGTELDRKITEDTMRLMSTHAHNAINQFNLRELAVLIKKARLFFGGDTGPMHLAVAVNTPAFVWMGPTPSWRTGPYPGYGLAVSLSLTCQPCYKRQCDNNLCLNTLPFEKVWKQTMEYLEKTELI